MRLPSCATLLLCFFPLLLNGQIAPSLANEVSQLRGAKMGVDHLNNFWAWNATTNSITRLSPTGDRVESGILPGASNVDADARRGIALLTDSGSTVQITDWTGNIVARFKLPEPAGDIAWVGDRSVAVTPRFGDHRVEIWNIGGTMVSRLGPCAAISLPKAGAVLARATLLRFDESSGELASLDSLPGDLLVMDLQGHVLRTARIPHPAAREIQPWLAQRDLEYRTKNEVFTPLIWRYPTLARTQDGTLWVGEKSSPDGSVVLTGVSKDATTRRLTVSVPDCPSLRFASWKGAFIFFHDPRTPGAACTGIKEK